MQGFYVKEPAIEIVAHIVKFHSVQHDNVNLLIMLHEKEFFADIGIFRRHQLYGNFLNASKIPLFTAAFSARMRIYLRLFKYSL